MTSTSIVPGANPNFRVERAGFAGRSPGAFGQTSSVDIDDSVDPHGFLWIAHMGQKVIRLGGPDRRAFLWAVTLGTLSLPIAANAQRGEKVYRLGVVSPGPTPIFMIPFGRLW